MQWSWDPDKDRTNRQKHGLSFATALHVFADPFALSELDRTQDREERWQTIGSIDGLMVVLVAHTYRQDPDGEEIIRIVSARRATSHERRRYEEERRSYL